MGRLGSSAWFLLSIHHVHFVPCSLLPVLDGALQKHQDRYFCLYCNTDTNDFHHQVAEALYSFALLFTSTRRKDILSSYSWLVRCHFALAPSPSFYSSQLCFSHRAG